MPTEENVTRKLRAILSADVKGYSLLMSDDEAFTVKTLKSYRKVMSAQIVRHKGRVVDAPGDNLLAEFASVVDAVQCSVEIQKILKERNEALTKDKRLEFRIGVNIGDVIQDGGNLYGEGVNIAARIEALAEPGGVCISRNAYDHVRNKLNYGYEYLGEHSVKNIKNPVRVYKLLMADEDAGKLIGDVKPVTKKWVWATAVLALIVITSVVWQVYQKMTEPEFEPALVEEMAFPLPEKPSIAVLPFDNMSGDPQQDNFSDGISEEIISALSKTEQLFVIARNSTFTYKGKPVKIKQVAEELGVRYVLEGSVRKAEGRVRITAQLIDATTGYHLWSERYDHDLKDIFALQDEITMKIVTALQIELTEGEQARMMASGNKSLDIHLKSMELASLFRQGTIEGMMRHGQTAREVIDMAPELPVGYRTLGWHHWWLAGSGKSPKENMKKALELAQKAISLNESESLSHALLGAIYLAYRQYEKAIAAGERSVELDPNGAQVHLLLGQSLNYAGRPEEAIVTIKKGIRLNPYPSFIYYRDLGLAYNQMGQYEKALIEFKKAQQLVPESYFVFHDLAITYSLLDRQEEARALATKCQELAPFISASWFSKRSRYKNQEHTKRIIDAMRKAGFPEYPPGKKLPEKPSIAVLPFDNLSDDPEQGYLADGLTDELIGDLAKIEGIFVISRNSTFTYKGKDIKITEVAKELNVRYVLEGSVQRAGNRLRIRAQLIDGKTDHHVWSESYDGDGTMDKMFELQDEITGKIVAALTVKLTENEKERISDKGTDNILAYDNFLKGKEFYYKAKPEDLVKAVGYFEKAIKIDPNFSRAYAELGNTYRTATNLAYRNFWEKLGIRYEVARLRSVHYLKLAMKNPSAEAYKLASTIEIHRRHYKEAVTHAKMALSILPNSAAGNLGLGWILVFAGSPDEAIDSLNKALSLNPSDIRTLGTTKTFIGIANFSKGNIEEAIKYLKEGRKYNPELKRFSCYLAASYALLGQFDEAQKELEIYKTTQGGYFQNIQEIYSAWPFKDSKVFDRLVEGLVKAGLPGKPSEYYKVVETNKLTGNEINDILFDKTMTGIRSQFDWSMKVDIDGITYLKAFAKDKSWQFYDEGKSWVEEDMLCQQMTKLWDDYTNCMELYKNPDGTADTKSEYIHIDYFGVRLFSVIDR